MKNHTNMKTSILIALFSLAITSSAATKKPSKPPEPTPEEIESKARERLITDAKETIANSLKDPESARFRNVFVSPKMLAVCGDVNAKNSMGGYVGFRRFIVAKDKIGTEEDGTYFVEANWNSRCREDLPD